MKDFLIRHKILVPLIVVVLAATVFCAFFATNGFYGLGKPDKAVYFEVEEGSGGSAVVSGLKDNHIIVSKTAFKVALRLSGQGANVKAGMYELSPKMSYGQIITALTNYSSAGLIKVTVPEGYKTTQVADLFAEKGLVSRDAFMEEVRNGSFDYAFLAELPVGEDARLEGYLFPDTYFISRGATAHEIIDMMLKQFEKVYTEGFSKRAAQLGYSDREILTLASIIEKEGSCDLDKISSVFHNRLDIGMRLESCATVNYLFDTPKDVLSVADTYIESPYNTYRNAGLPPAPICSPGKAAIEAALYPAETDYLYFVADGKGGNLFSKTYDEHLEKGTK